MRFMHETFLSLGLSELLVQEHLDSAQKTHRFIATRFGDTPTVRLDLDYLGKFSRARGIGASTFAD